MGSTLVTGNVEAFFCHFTISENIVRKYNQGFFFIESKQSADLT